MCRTRRCSVSEQTHANTLLIGFLWSVLPVHMCLCERCITDDLISLGLVFVLACRLNRVFQGIRQKYRLPHLSEKPESLYVVVTINKPSLILCNPIVWLIPVWKYWHSPYLRGTCKSRSPCLTGLCARRGEGVMDHVGISSWWINSILAWAFHFHADSFFNSGYSCWCLVLE